MITDNKLASLVEAVKDGVAFGTALQVNDVYYGPLPEANRRYATGSADFEILRSLFCFGSLEATSKMRIELTARGTIKCLKPAAEHTVIMERE